MTSDLIDLRNSIISITDESIRQEQNNKVLLAQAIDEERFDHLLSRLDNLRSIANARKSKRYYQKRLQTSFSF